MRHERGIFPDQDEHPGQEHAIATIILTKNEARHIARAIKSVQSVSDRVLVVDSGSTDDTCAIARGLGAEVLSHPWTTHAIQFNWALDALGAWQGWILRLDADEIISPDLAEEIGVRLPLLPRSVNGVFLKRVMTFQRQPVRWGGVSPTRVMRLFRAGTGRCETHWMDEYIQIEGGTEVFDSPLIDDSLLSLTEWIEKHNQYASREVVDILSQGPESGLPSAHFMLPDRRRRWVKERIYNSCPAGLRSALYFIYRFVLRLGVLDGKEARRFHVLQAFWYRYLVDAKLSEVRQYMRNNDTSTDIAIKAVLGVSVNCRDTS